MKRVVGFCFVSNLAFESTLVLNITRFVGRDQRTITFQDHARLQPTYIFLLVYVLISCTYCRHYSTVGQNDQKYRLQYWATHSSARLFARRAHSFACSGLLAFRCAHSFARSVTFLTLSLVEQCMIGWLFCLCFFLFRHIVYSLMTDLRCSF